MKGLMKRENFSFYPVPAHRKQRGKMLAKYTNASLDQLGTGNSLVQAVEANPVGELYPDR